MASITITRDSQGKLVGAGPKSEKAYARFKKMLHELEAGEMATISHWFPRNAKLHGWHMVVLAAVFETQEQFENEKRFRKWCEIGADFCDWIPGPTGRMIPIEKSIAWDELDDADFSIHHENTIAFFRSTYCTRFLWPHLSDPQGSDMIEGILTEAEIRREEIKLARRMKRSA